MLHQLNLSKGNSRFFLFTVCFLMFSLGLAAQAQIKGKVTDAQGNGLAGITVNVQNTTYSTATDLSGNYTLSANLRPGTYSVVFSGVGFRSVTQQANVTAAGDVSVDAQLTADALNLDEVVVTGVSAGTTRR